MLTQLDCLPADVRAGNLGVQWNATMPPVLAEAHIHASEASTSLHLAIIGGSHVITVDAPSGRFREEISCHASDEPLPRQAQRDGYELETHTSKFTEAEFSARADEIADGGLDWLIAEFPGVGRHHLTALRGEYQEGQWHWWTHHLYPAETTIVSTRSSYKP